MPSFPRTAHRLIGNRLSEAHVAGASPHHEFAVRIDAQLCRMMVLAHDFEAQRAGISARRQIDIKLKLPLVAIPGNVNAGINPVILHSGILWGILHPLCRVLTDEVIASSSLSAEAFNAGRGICSRPPEAEDIFADVSLVAAAAARLRGNRWLVRIRDAPFER